MLEPQPETIKEKEKGLDGAVQSARCGRWWWRDGGGFRWKRRRRGKKGRRGEVEGVGRRSGGGQ